MISKFIGIWVLLCVCLNNHVFGWATKSNFEEDLDGERKLKNIVKTIKFKGDIVDCVPIDKQPALDHLLLKNHKIQMRPQSYPIGVTKSSSIWENVPLKSDGKTCSTGTVPIYRIGKKNLVKARRHSELFTTTYKNGPTQHQVYIEVKEDPKIKHYGAIAYISNSNINVEQDQRSSANIWVQNGFNDHVNVISVGWMACPIYFKDSVPRLFTFWKGDKLGCFNMFCKGFIQIDSQIAAGYPMVQQNETMLGFKYYVYQDRPTRNWWFFVIKRDETRKYSELIKVGYWPKEIFTELGDGARQVAWGAEVVSGQSGVSPPMGSGHLPYGDYNSDTFFSIINHIDDKNVTKTPPNILQYTDKSKCFDLIVGDYEGLSFTYGGRSGYCDH